MFERNSRNANNSRNESNNRTANTVWTLSKAGILAKTVKLATAWRGATAAETIGTIQRSTAEGRPATTLLASAGTPKAQYETQLLLRFCGNLQKVVRTVNNS